MHFASRVWFGLFVVVVVTFSFFLNGVFGNLVLVTQKMK